MIDVRGAELRDNRSLRALDVDTWSPRVSPGPAREAASPFFTDQTQPEGILVAAADGSVVGYVSLHQSIRLPSHRHVLEIDGLAVDPAWHGRGVGRRLMDEAKREAHRRGASKLTLRVLAPNRPARRLYEACGFSIEGVLAGEFLLEGQFVDDVLMACRLG